MRMIQIDESTWINESTIRRINVVTGKIRVLEILSVDGVQQVQGLWVGAVMNQLGLHRDHTGGLDASNKPLDRPEVKG